MNFLFGTLRVSARVESRSSTATIQISVEGFVGYRLKNKQAQNVQSPKKQWEAKMTWTNAALWVANFLVLGGIAESS